MYSGITDEEDLNMAAIRPHSAFESPQDVIADALIRLMKTGDVYTVRRLCLIIPSSWVSITHVGEPTINETRVTIGGHPILQISKDCPPNAMKLLVMTELNLLSSV